MVSVSIALPENLVAALKALKQRDGIPRNEQIRRGIRMFLAAHRIPIGPDPPGLKAKFPSGGAILARQLGISRQRVHQLQAAGQLPVLREYQPKTSGISRKPGRPGRPRKGG